MEDIEHGDMVSRCAEKDAAGAQRIAKLMGEYITGMSDAERDRMLQRHLAQAMTVEQKAVLLSGMMNFVIGINQMRMSEAVGK